MNLYFLIEGEVTEYEVYSKWVNYLLPTYSKVDFVSEVVSNQYFIFSGGGIPSIYNHAVNAIRDVNSMSQFDFLIICLDGEDLGVEDRLNEIEKYINESGVKIRSDCRLAFIIQNICIETWFLGNRKIIRRQPDGPLLREYLDHYNVIENDPEEMNHHVSFKTKAKFHFSYFKEALKEHNLSYSKKNPRIVTERYFLTELVKRVDESEHLTTFKEFLKLMRSIEVQSE